MSRLSEHKLECEVLVAGGGPAGVCCALAAARLGVRTLLCQDRHVLGGNASSEVRMHIVGATGLREGLPLQVENREGGLIEEIRLELATRNPQRSPSMMDLLLYEKCRAEPNLTLMLNTAVVAVEMAGDRIERAIAERQSTEDRFSIGAKIFVDCTGDGRLGVEAGAPFRHGREGRSEHGESLAVAATGDGRTLGSTLLFQARKHDRPMPFVAPPWVRKFKPEDFRLRPFGKRGSDLGLEYGYWWAEWGGCLDTIKDNEHIRDELLAITLGVWNHIKNESDVVEASHWALEWLGFLPGKRESRRFVGQHVLTEQDAVESREFPDAIAFGGWPIDTHPPEGVDAPGEPPCNQHHLPCLYNIPLRSCISAGPRNLMFAGRNISATHIAFASTRVMATCAVIGQGVGTAAAVAVRENVVPAELATRADLVHRIQQRLLRDDCYLVGIRNADAQDLARGAAAHASSEQAEGRAANVLSGQTRSVHGYWTEAGIRAAAAAGWKPRLGGENLWDSVLRKVEHGGDPEDITFAPPDRCFPGTHRWMSDPAAGLPAWLELRWNEPVALSEVILIFDTGQHRHLTLTQADGYRDRMVWGRPQPETVRDYALEVEDGGAWRTLHVEQGNYQRRRAHRFDPVTTRAVRMRVLATNGLDHARILEVRAYA
ncbi:MAG: FAD-dependent oxidoreductase [Verrucomicrobia bacterium]|nr:FAD-dependent oxidoreductase [Verrucomicrobiota bacterium]